MSNLIPCTVLIPFGDNAQGDLIWLNAAEATELSDRHVVRVEIKLINNKLVGDRIVELAEEEMELLRELIHVSPDDLTRHKYKRRLAQLEKGDLRP